MSEQQIADGARPRARVGDEIAHGEPVPGNVVRMTDMVTDVWHRAARDPLWFTCMGGDPVSVAGLRETERWWPMTVVEVDPEPQPAIPLHRYEPAPGMVCAVCGRSVMDDIHPDVQREQRCPDREPHEAHEAHEHNGFARPEGVPSAWCPGRQPATPGPLVLTLPEVPAEATLVGGETGDRYTPEVGVARYRDDRPTWRIAGWFGDIGEVLSREHPKGVTVELAPPREPRTWPKLDPVPADVLRVRGASGAIWERRGTDDGAWHNEDWSKVRSWGALAVEDGPLAEVLP